MAFCYVFVCAIWGRVVGGGVGECGLDECREGEGETRQNNWRTAHYGKLLERGKKSFCWEAARLNRGRGGTLFRTGAFHVDVNGLYIGRGIQDSTSAQMSTNKGYSLSKSTYSLVRRHGLLNLDVFR